MLSDSSKPSLLPNPSAPINQYLWGMMKRMDSGLVGTNTAPGPYVINGKEIMPIFPVSDAASGTFAEKDKPYILYNQLRRPTKDPFYPVKNVNFIYGVKGNVDQSFEWTNAITVILDRGDDTAREINQWMREHPRRVRYSDGSEKVEYMPLYFHNLRVFQVEPGEPGDYVNDAPIFTNLIVQAQFHWTNSIHDITKTKPQVW